nr:ribonuclease H-like domain-containing protein [Tanacetum cinerariifolium]
EGYRVVSPPYTGIFMPPKSDLVFHDAPNVNETIHTALNVELSLTKPDKDLSLTHRPSVPIIKDWVSDSEDDSEAELSQNVPSFVLPSEQVKNSRPSVKPVENSIPTANPKTTIPKPKSHGHSKNRKACFGNPHHALKDKGVIDSGCSRHIIGNMSYLSDFEEINGGYVAFGGNPKGGKIYSKGKIRTGKLDFDDVYFVKELKLNLFSVSQMCDKKNNVLFTYTKCILLSPEFKLPDENQVLLRVPKEKNMDNVDIKNILPSRDLTCLFTKVTFDESNLWHGRLGHINFKTMNKLVKSNLVRGLPSKVFENNHTCVAYKKGKQHRASCKFDRKADEGFLVRYSPSSSGLTLLFDINTLTKTMNYQPVTAGNQSNPSVGVLEQLDAEKAGKENVQQYVLFPVWSSGSKNPQNTDGDAAFETKKHDDKTKREAKGKSPVESSTGYRNLCAEFEDFSNNSINEVNAANSSVPAVGKISTNSTNTFSAAGPSNTAVSPTHGKSSYMDTSQYPDDPNMPELEDNTYSYDEKDVGAGADFTNLETSITVSPIPTTRVHKDHHVTQIIGDLSLTT